MLNLPMSKKRCIKGENNKVTSSLRGNIEQSVLFWHWSGPQVFTVITDLNNSQWGKQARFLGHLLEYSSLSACPLMQYILHFTFYIARHNNYGYNYHLFSQYNNINERLKLLFIITFWSIVWIKFILIVLCVRILQTVTYSSQDTFQAPIRQRNTVCQRYLKNIFIFSIISIIVN